MSVAVTSSATSQVDRENPWPGLESFTEGDAEFFHGRDVAIGTLLQLVAREDLILLYGTSGLGKTSLLRAGLFPRLPPNIMPVYVRLSYGDDGGQASGAVDLRQQVFEAVRREAEARRIEVPPPAPSGTLWEFLRRRDEPFWGAGSELVIPLLVFDQFEQLFTRDIKRSIPQGRIDEFLNDLGDLVNGRMPAWLVDRAREATSGAEFIFESSGCKALFSFREDYLADVKRLDTIISSIDHNALRLEPMRWIDAVGSIRAAGSHVLAPLPAGATAGGAADVAAAIANVVSDESGRERGIVDPSILCVFCQELNEERKQRLAGGGAPFIDLALVTSKKAPEIISTFYHRAVEQVPPAVRRFIERELITSSRTGEWVRDSVASERLEQPDLPRAALNALIDKWRILRFEGVGKRKRLELTHDVLVKPVLADRVASEELARLRQERERREAQLKSSLQKRALVVVGAVALVAVFSAAVAIRNGRQARTAQVEAESQLLGRAIIDAIDVAREGNTGEGLAQAADLIRKHPENEAIRSLTLDLLLRSTWPVPLGGYAENSPAVAAEFSRDGHAAFTLWGNGLGRLWRPETGKTIAKLSDVSFAHFSLDGRFLAVAGSRVDIRDAESGRPITELVNYASRPMDARFDPTTQYVAVAFPESVIVWRVRDWKRVTTIGEKADLLSIDFSPSSPQPLLTAWRDGKLRVWHIPSGREVGPQLEVPDLDRAFFSPRGTWIATASHSKTDQSTTIRLWAAGSRTPFATLPVQQPSRTTVAVWRAVQFSPDERFLVTTDGLLAHIWDLARLGQSERPRSTDLRHRDVVINAAFSADGRHVVTTSADGLARVWYVATGQQAFAPLTHSDAVYSAEFNRAGDRIVTASGNRNGFSLGVSTAWGFESKAAQPTVLDAGAPIASVVFASDGKQVIAGDSTGGVHIWDADSGAVVQQLGISGKSPVSLDLGPDDLIQTDAKGRGNRLLGFSGRTLQLWTALEGKWSERRQTVLTADVTSARFDSTGGRVVAGSSDGNLTIWNTETGETKSTLLVAYLRPTETLSVDFSRDGRFVVGGYRGDSARLWDATNLQQVGEPLSTGHDVIFTRFSPDGKRLVTTSSDGRAFIWNVGGGPKPIATLQHNGPVVWAVFSPDNQRALTASADGTVRIWEASTGRALARPLAHNARVTAGNLSRDGSRALTGSTDGTVRISDGVSGLPLANAITIGSPVTAVRLDPSGGRAAIGSEDGKVRVFAVPRVPESNGPWLALFAEAIGGMELDESGSPHPTDLGDRLKSIFDLRARALKGAGNPITLQQRVEQWFFTPLSERRTLSPFTAARER